MSSKATSSSFAMQPPSRSYKVSTAALRQIGEEPVNRRRRRRQLSQSDREWQSECFDYAEKVGELGALLEMQSNTLSLCGFPVRRWDADAAAWVANDPEFDEGSEGDQAKLKADSQYDPRPGNVMRAFVGPDGGFEEQIRRAGYHLFCTGETTLLGSDNATDGILWEFLSVEELRLNSEGVYTRHASHLSGEEKLSEDDYTARLHLSSYRYSALATSQVKRVLPILQEIVTLTMMVDAVAKSRVSANLLFIPDELTFAPDPEPQEGDLDEGGDPNTPPGDLNDDAVDEDSLIDDLFEHMTAPLTDPGSAARIVPIIIRGKAEFGKEIRVISLARELDMWAQELRMEALGRLAQGLDAPPEAMSGKGTANHWTAANIDSEFIIKHIQPMGRRIAAFLTTSYLRPMLMLFENMTAEQADQFMVEFDPSPVIARADEAKSARDLAEWLSDEALLSANGFTKADLASSETVRQRRLWTLIKDQPGTYARLLPLLKGFEDVDPELIGPAQPPAPAPGEEPQDGSEVTRDADGDNIGQGDEIVDETSGTETPDKPEGMALLIERLVTAADADLRRARERAANKVVSSFQSKPEVRTRLAQLPKNRVLCSLTTDERQSFTGRRQSALLANAWDEFETNAAYWIAEFLAERADATVAQREAMAAAATMRARLEEYGTRTLFDPITRNGNGLHVPTNLIADIIEQAVLAEVA